MNTRRLVEEEATLAKWGYPDAESMDDLEWDGLEGPLIDVINRATLEEPETRGLLLDDASGDGTTSTFSGVWISPFGTRLQGHDVIEWWSGENSECPLNSSHCGMYYSPTVGKSINLYEAGVHTDASVQVIGNWSPTANDLRALAQAHDQDALEQYRDRIAPLASRLEHAVSYDDKLGDEVNELIQELDLNIAEGQAVAVFVYAQQIAELLRS